MAVVILAGAGIFALSLKPFASEQNKNRLRGVPPLIGTVLIVIAIWVAASQIHCGTPLPDPQKAVGPIVWRAPMVDWSTIVVVLAVSATWLYRTRSFLGVLTIFCFLAFAIAGDEMATYHVGIQSVRWGGIAFLALLVTGLIWFLDERIKGRHNRSRLH